MRIQCQTFQKPKGSETVEPTSTKLGTCILWSGDKTSRKRNVEFQHLRRAAEMTTPPSGVLTYYQRTVGDTVPFNINIHRMLDLVCITAAAAAAAAVTTTTTTTATTTNTITTTTTAILIGREFVTCSSKICKIRDFGGLKVPISAASELLFPSVRAPLRY